MSSESSESYILKTIDSEFFKGFTKNAYEFNKVMDREKHQLKWKTDLGNLFIFIKFNKRRPSINKIDEMEHCNFLVKNEENISKCDPTMILAWNSFIDESKVYMGDEYLNYKTVNIEDEREITKKSYQKIPDSEHANKVKFRKILETIPDDVRCLDCFDFNEDKSKDDIWFDRLRASFVYVRQNNCRPSRKYETNAKLKYLSMWISNQNQYYQRNATTCRDKVKKLLWDVFTELYREHVGKDIYYAR